MKRPINPAAIRAPFAQYSHAVEVPAGRILFASGQLGVSPDDQVPEDAEAQAVLCFENIKAILAEAGMTFADVVRFTAYVTDRAYFPVYGAVRSRYVSGQCVCLHAGDRLGLHPARVQGRGGGHGGGAGWLRRHRPAYADDPVTTVKCRTA